MNYLSVSNARINIIYYRLNGCTEFIFSLKRLIRALDARPGRDSLQC